MTDKSWSVYLVRCKDNSLYCGISNDVQKRVITHNKGKGAKYTKYRVPVVLVYCEEIGALGDALRRERQIKNMSKNKKEQMITCP